MKKILFKPEMIRAIIDGKKTQTRRIHKDMNKPRYAVGEVVYMAEPYFKDNDGRIFYKANMPSIEADFCRKQFSNAMFMPEKYARLFLKITAVKKESIGEISEADAMAEGFCSCLERNSSAVQEFLLYFTKINPAAAPTTEVWAYTFEVVKK